jgi:hypothetical protein
VPTGFWLGGRGVFQNLGPLGGGRSTMCFRKTKFPKNLSQKHFSRNFKNFQRTNPSFFKNFAILACQGPLPTSWAPLFYFFGGVLYFVFNNVKFIGLSSKQGIFFCTMAGKIFFPNFFLGIIFFGPIQNFSNGLSLNKYIQKIQSHL